MKCQAEVLVLTEDRWSNLKSYIASHRAGVACFPDLLVFAYTDLGQTGGKAGEGFLVGLLETAYLDLQTHDNATMYNMLYSNILHTMTCSDLA